MTSSSSHSEFQGTVIVGGGLAGIAAAAALAAHQVPVLLLEARAQLGGRATSYTDRETGETIDNCQHVSMGCCTNLQTLCRMLGLEDAFRREQTLYFVSPLGLITPFSATRWPAPFHLFSAFLALPYLDWNDKYLFARGVQALAQAKPAQLQGVCFADWLREHSQTERLIRQVWEVVLVSALSETLDRIDAAAARKVFVDGFLSHSRAWEVEIPVVDLEELYSRRTRQALQQQGVEVRPGTRISAVKPFSAGNLLLHLPDGSTMSAADVIVAVPQHQLGSLISDIPELSTLTAQAEQMESAPITSVHLWYDQVLTTVPHAVLVNRLSQWLFNRGMREIHQQNAQYLQVVISASRELAGESQEEIIRKIDAELRAIWPENQPRLLHARMITERRAVFAVTPGIDALRPEQQTALPGLQVAGDWTRTGWPATMEGAVISGFKAAENVLARRQIPDACVQPGLPVALLSRWLLGIRAPRT